MKKIKNPWIGKEGYQCIGCCPTNEAGLKMEFYEDGEEIVSLWKPQARYQGWIDVLHGGIQALLLDEMSGWVVSRKLQTAAVTAPEIQNGKKYTVVIGATIEGANENGYAHNTTKSGGTTVATVEMTSLIYGSGGMGGFGGGGRPGGMGGNFRP